MINVISSEFYKVFKSRIFYVISIIFLAMNCISLAASLYLKLKGQMNTTGFSMYQESYGQDLAFYVILMFVVSLITSEYTNGSIKQIACHGIARWKLVLGQYIAMSSSITIILLSFGVLNLFIYTILYRLGEANAVSFIRMNIGLICMFWAMSGIGTFLSYLIKSVSVSIIVSILLVIGSNFISGLLTVLTKNDVFTTYSLASMRKTIINFNSQPEDVIKCSIIFLLIGIASLLGSSLLFSKKDID